jgi:ankyrin repeat protein
MPAPTAPEAWERIGVFASALLFIVAMVAIAITVPNPTTFQAFVFRVVLALAAAAFGAFIPGFLNIESRVFRNRVRAGSALGLFVLVYLVNPPAWVASVGSDHEVEGRSNDGRRQLAALGIPYTEEEFRRRIKNGDTPAVKLFHRAGIRLGGRGADGDTPLIVAIEEGHQDIADYLISNGASINETNQRGETPVMTAAAFGEEEILRGMIAARGDVNMRDSGGRTPVMAAAFMGQTATVAALVTAGASLNLQDFDGNTALTYAAMEGQTEIVQLLLRGGAIPEMRNKKGKRAIDEAKDRHHDATARTLGAARARGSN